jgi:hypothetical protein
MSAIGRPPSPIPAMLTRVQAMTPLYVVLQGASPDAQLSRAEIETLFEFAFRVHNHDASTPAQPLFWVRSDSQDLWKFAN